MSSSSSNRISDNNNAATSNQESSNLVNYTPKPITTWDELPEDLKLKVLGNLDPRTLVAASSSCKSWHNAANNPAFEEIKERSWQHYDPRMEFAAVQVIDEKVWRSVFGPETLALHDLTFDDADPLDGKALRNFLSGLDFSRIEGTGVNTGVTILTLPKGLTFNKLRALAAKPKEGGRAAPFRHVWPRITEELGDAAIQKTKTIAISNNILKKSRDNTYEEREQMARDVGGEVPGFLPVATLCTLTYMSTPADPPTRLFNNNPWAYTICAEEIDGFHLAIGAFAQTGLVVNGSFGSDSLGVGFVWDFKPNGP